MTLGEDYLEQKVEHCQRLYDLTIKAIDILDADHLDNLDETMEERRKTVEDIQHLDGVYKDKCDLGKENSSQIKAAIARVRELLQHVQVKDVELTEKLKSTMEGKTLEYHQARNARKVHTAYHGGGDDQGSLIDRQR